MSKHLPKAIEKILKTEPEGKVYGIGFITTDDFYGFYLAYDYISNDSDCSVYEYFNWEHGYNSDFLYQPLVNVVEAVEASRAIDFTEKSKEKWEFCVTLLAILSKHIGQIPSEIFTKNNHNRDDIIFFATMSDGDYIYEMMGESIITFNTAATVAKYGLNSK